MKTYKLTSQDRELIKLARDMSKNHKIDTRQVACDVGCALITKKGNIYKGINIESKLSGPTSICSETAAIASMISNGEKSINTIACVYENKGKTNVMQPCGSCRHVISQFGDPFVIISKDKKVKLNALYPLPIK
ncbi:MAG: cytidine deaminase [archaeon]